jgi:PEP-CTERM motif
MSERGRARASFVQHILAAAVLALVVPVVAHADGITYDNSGGTTKLTSTGAPGATNPTNQFSLTNSAISSIDGTGVSGQGFSLTFNTSNSFTGSLETGGGWAAGGSFTINEKGVGVIFSGTFSGPPTWTLDSTAGCTSCQYQLNGALSGTYYANGKGNGPGVAIVTGTTAQIDLTTHNGGLYTGANHLVDMSGTTGLVTPVPEPGSLALMGTGLLGVAFTIKRKIRAGADFLRNL